MLQTGIRNNPNLERGLVIPIVHSIGAKIDVVVRRGWSVDKDGTNDAIAVLV